MQEASPTEPRKQNPENVSQSKSCDFLVVGLGASAGGLQAARKLLEALPADTGMAFVFIQHLDPTHESLMADLLGRDTKMRVSQAADGVVLEPNALYVIPPHAELSIRDGVLQLSEPQALRGARMPFDFFLDSLADDCGERAICVILSGTGSDGSIGLKAISEKGGLVIAQEPGEAAYGGMPQAAIATGLVNLILPVAQIPGALLRYAKHPYVAGDRKTAASLKETASKPLAALIELLRARTAHDFSHYKTATLLRRVRRRMAAAGITDFDAYIEALDKDERELEALAKDLLIHVTSFFRDPAAYEALANYVIPEIVRKHPADAPLRVWTPGCSTGEEVYSLAILFFEEFAVQQRSLKLQIFASDISADAVAFGRNGLYPETIAAAVTAERLLRFFTREDHGFRVSRDLRDAVVFAVQDLLTDPPFSRLDLVSCRNLLIYLQPIEQEKVLALFHFALREGGFLFLGAAETIGKLSDRFVPVANAQRVFRRIGSEGAAGAAKFSKVGDGGPHLQWPRVAMSVERKRLGIGDFARQLLLETFAPAAVLINRKEQGLYFFGPTDRYLRVATGELNCDLSALLRNGLTSAFRMAVRRACADDAPATVSAKVKRDGSVVVVNISARPVMHEGAELLLVSFSDSPAQSVSPAVELPAESSRAAQLEAELETTRNELESTIRDLEASNQELTSLNEEAISMNEEFQSTNEELETSREELQSLNEELITSNSQLQDSLARESKTRSDLENILKSSEIATLFLDKDLNVRFFTPACAPLFNLIPSDIGRPLGHLMPRFSNVDIVAEAQSVLTTLAPKKREMESGTGVWYLCTISPYRTEDDLVSGVVINLADLSTLKASKKFKEAAEQTALAKKAAEAANLAKSRFLAAASHDLRQPLQTLVILQGVLRRIVKDERALEVLVKSDQAIENMSGILTSLLDINRLEAGAIQPNLEEFKVADVLDSLASEFAEVAEVKGLQWRYVSCGLLVRSDPRLLMAMVRNLLSNAIHYTDKGKILLGCRHRGDRLRIEVLDTGIGISQDHFSQIFEEYRQAHNSPRKGGLGLGLSIVDRLGKLLGHAIDMRSSEGKGSMFAIEVPRLAVAKPSVAAQPTQRQDESWNDRRGVVLLIEDDLNVRESLALFLRLEGYEVVDAESGEGALAIVADKAAQPDVILSDFMLSGSMHGLQTIAALRAAAREQIPAIVLTGDIKAATLRTIEESGFIVLSKPVEPEELLRVIQRTLGDCAQ